MEQIINFFKDNYQWVFSGIGLPVLGYLFFRKKSNAIEKKNDRRKIRNKISNVHITADHGKIVGGDDNSVNL